MTRAFAAVLAFLAALVVGTSARADSVDVKASVDPTTVEIGEVLTYSLQAQLQGTATIADPQPGPHPNFTIVATSSTPTHWQMSINGTRSEIQGLSTTYALRAQKLGTFTIGPGTVVVGGAKRSAQAIRVTVVPKGQAPQRRPAIPTNPFDMFGGSGGPDPFRGFFDFGDEPRPQPSVTTDPKLALDAPRAPVAFLHATVDKTRAVVGEQVTLKILLYEDASAQEEDAVDVHEATATDFVKRSLVEDESRLVPVGVATVGGRLWSVKLVRKNALFPIRTGTLTIDPMSLTLARTRGGKRESERLVVEVSDPPAAGRPPGFVSGDVGEFSLQSTVTPRALERDGAIGIVVELRGTGNLPAKLPVPIAQGIEWLEPTMNEKLGAMQNDRYGGTRTFSYVVKVHREGAVDLGEVRLPYFNPASGTYAIARAALGIVDVAKGKDKPAATETAEQILPNLPRPEATLEGPRKTSYVSDRPWLWLALWGAPLACALAIGGSALVKKLREKRAAASPSRDRIARDRRAEAEAACSGDDGGAAIAAVVRAIEASILASTGVNVRGASIDVVERELLDAGVEAERARTLTEQLRSCEAVRFHPDGVSVADAKVAWRRAEKVLSALAVVLLVVFGSSGSAHAADPDEQVTPNVLFREAAHGLEEGRPQEAIVIFEALGDRGIVDAVLSYDRGLAYAERVRLGGEVAGDLGRAAHGFEEALELTEQPALAKNAERALTSVRAEIARRRGRLGDSTEIDHGISLGLSIARLLPENVWALLATLASFALSTGIVLRGSAAGRLKVAGTTACGVALFVLTLSTGLLYYARHVRLQVVEGVVVTSGRLLDDRHIAKPDSATIAEGARVRILESNTDFVRISVGYDSGFLPTPSVLPMAKR